MRKFDQTTKKVFAMFLCLSASIRLWGYCYHENGTMYLVLFFHGVGRKHICLCIVYYAIMIRHITEIYNIVAVMFKIVYLECMQLLFLNDDGNSVWHIHPVGIHQNDQIVKLILHNILLPVFQHTLGRFIRVLERFKLFIWQVFFWLLRQEC